MDKQEAQQASSRLPTPRPKPRHHHSPSTGLNLYLTTTLRQYSEETDDSAVRTGPRNAEDYNEIINELIEIGIITQRINGKLDLPDVYRIGFDLGRKGGVPRIQG